MIGTSLSHYKIVAELGRGGMGIVYKAEDTKLERTVAIKVLPSATLASEDDRARFYREAKAAAQLHHPHIASIFEIDEAVPSGAPHDAQPSPFIAMEFIDGETLSSRIAKGPLKIEEAVRLAKEVASALEAAHDKDIVHRDIKSANVMVTAKGGAKVLDFGLAKTAHSTMLTRMGSTLGTFAYMSPEQARGEEVDRRTDIWALGAVLYEMICGRPPFAGDYEQAVVYSILNEDPEPLTAVRTGVPMGLEWIVAKTMAKNADDRYQSITDLMVDLKNVDTASLALSRSTAGTSRISTAHAELPSSSERLQTKKPVSVIIGVLAGLVLIALAWFGGSLSSGTDPQPFRKLKLHFDGISDINFPVMSPNRDYIAFEGRDTTGVKGIFLYELATGETRFMDGTEDHGYPLFSPDGSRLASGSAGIWVTAIPRGLPVRWSPLQRPEAWEDDETIILTVDGDVYRLHGRDADPELIVRADTMDGNEQYIFPGDILREEKTLLSSFQFASNENANLITVDLVSGSFKALEPAAINAWFVKGGFVVYQLGTDTGRIVVRRFNRKSLQWGGRAEDLLPQTDWSEIRPTPDGDLLYVPPSSVRITKRLEWLDQDGNRTVARVLDDKVWFSLELSPDGRSVLVSRSDSEILWDVSLMAIDIVSGDQASLTESAGFNSGTWSPDGLQIYRGTSGYYASNVVRQRVRTLNITDTIREDARDPHLSPDGTWLVYTHSPSDSDFDIHALNLQTGDSTVVASSSDIEQAPRISSNNRWVTYIANTTDASELRVSSLDGSWTTVLARDINSPGRWSSDGRYVYFLKSRDLRRIQVDSDQNFAAVGTEERVTTSGLIRDFSVDQTSGRILLLTDDRPPASFTVLEWWQNWSSELERTLPKSE